VNEIDSIECENHHFDDYNQACVVGDGTSNEHEYDRDYKHKCSQIVHEVDVLNKVGFALHLNNLHQRNNKYEN
jgi:hypothetical protein